MFVRVCVQVLELFEENVYEIFLFNNLCDWSNERVEETFMSRVYVYVHRYIHMYLYICLCLKKYTYICM